MFESKTKTAQGCKRSYLKLGIFVCSFDVCRASEPVPSEPVPSINYENYGTLLVLEIPNNEARQV